MNASRSIKRFLALGGLLTAAALLGACASLPAPRPMPATHAIDDVASTRLARIARQNARPGASELSGFRLLPEAPFSFNARIALARRAEKSIDVQYYELRNDGVGRQLLRELRDASRRGVRVRLLVDDLYMAGADALFSSLAAHPHVEVRLFNPLPARAGSLLSRIAFSMHDVVRSLPGAGPTALRRALPGRDPGHAGHHGDGPPASVHHVVVLRAWRDRAGPDQAST